MVFEQLGELLPVKIHRILGRLVSKYLYGCRGGLEVLLRLAECRNPCRLDPEMPELSEVWGRREKPISLRTFQQDETVKHTHPDPETVLEVTQEFTSEGILDQFWQERIPQS